MYQFCYFLILDTLSLDQFLDSVSKLLIRLVKHRINKLTMVDVTGEKVL